MRQMKRSHPQFSNGIYTIDIPYGMNAFDVLEMLSWNMKFEEVAHALLRKEWENEQGCSQSMRDD